MGCNLPLRAFQLRGGGITIGWEPKKEGNPFRLPCGKCSGCKHDDAHGWALRCYLEMQEHTQAAFVTLTYDEQHLPLCLIVRDLQLWLKRFRKAVGADRPIRHFACGEYGSLNKRPHYHALLFGASERDVHTVANTWRMGRTECSPVTPKRIAYCAGYTNKKIHDRYEETGVVDPDTGEWLPWQKPFRLMSRGGRSGKGLAHVAREKYAASWKDYAVSNGYKLPVPKYLHAGWEAQATPEEREANKLLRKLKSAEHALTRDMLQANEAIMAAKSQLDAERRRG